MPETDITYAPYAVPIDGDLYKMVKRYVLLRRLVAISYERGFMGLPRPGPSAEMLRLLRLEALRRRVASA